MDNRRKKPEFSSFPIQWLAKKLPDSPKIPVTDIEQALEDALEVKDHLRALEILDDAPRWMKGEPQFILIRASVLNALGDHQEALRLLRNVEQKNPRFMPVYPFLAWAYRYREWPAHALQAARRALTNRNTPADIRTELEQIIEDATALIQRHAAEHGLSFERMQRAHIFHERAQIAIDENKLSEADYFSKEAVKIAPDWSPPHNNRAQALYFSGKEAEAIAVSEAVLAREAENIYAMSSLVTYHFGLNQPEQARDYAARLGQLSHKFTAGGIEIEHIIKALALVQDTSALWEITKRYLNAPSDTLFSRSWYCLAVAAVRSGKWKDALKLVKKADEDRSFPAAKNLLDELKKVINQRQPHLSWMPPAYPGADLFLHVKVIAEWEGLLQNLSDPLTPAQERKLKGFFQKYSFMWVAMKLLLWEKSTHLSALQILESLEIPGADAEILRFALSQSGNQEARTHALTLLMQTGRYTGPKIVKVWNDDLEEWRDVELNTQRIGDLEANIRPETQALIEKAYKSKDPQVAISLLRKGIERDPTCPILYFNLGVLLVQMDKIEEGEALIFRSVEVDPNYTYGHASIALSEADKGREQEALDHLGIVTRADIIAPDTAVMANLAWAKLAIHKHDFKSARQRLDMAALIAPEHSLLKTYEEMLEEAEDFDEKHGFLIELQRKSAQHTHQRLLKTPLKHDMGLYACLETINRQMLVGMARFLQVPSSGKKGELVARLVTVLLDPQSLQRLLEKSWEKKEREALQWMLEADGVRAWKEFVRNYGDDMEESTAWDIIEPVSIPGRLRMSGLFYSGTVEGQQVAFIPADARLLLRRLLQ